MSMSGDKVLGRARSKVSQKYTFFHDQVSNQHKETLKRYLVRRIHMHELCCFMTTPLESYNKFDVVYFIKILFKRHCLVRTGRNSEFQLFSSKNVLSCNNHISP